MLGSYWCIRILFLKVYYKLKNTENLINWYRNYEFQTIKLARGSAYCLFVLMKGGGYGITCSLFNVLKGSSCLSPMRKFDLLISSLPDLYNWQYPKLIWIKFIKIRRFCFVGMFCFDIMIVRLNISC